MTGKPSIKLKWRKRKPDDAIINHRCEVWIDGHQMRGVVSVDLHVDGSQALPELTVRFMPGELDLDGPVDAILTAEGRQVFRTFEVDFESERPEVEEPDEDEVMDRRESGPWNVFGC